MERTAHATALEMLQGDDRGRAECLACHATGFGSESGFTSLKRTPELAGESIVATAQAIFSRSPSPKMKVRWDTYLDNNQHLTRAGCFRCHAGNMVSADGRTVSSACSTCHSIRGQGRHGDACAYDPNGLPFVHPPDGEIMDTPTLCHDCHDGSLGW